MNSAPRLADLEPISKPFFDGDVDEVAKALIGAYVCTSFGPNEPTGGQIVETEAYDEADPAAHCHAEADLRRRQNCEAMRLEGGYIYLYTYRINPARNPALEMWCTNFSTGRKGFGSAVLVRALEPLWGLEQMKTRRIEGAQAAGLQAKDLRGSSFVKHLCNGPANLSEALGIPGSLDGRSLFEGSISLFERVQPIRLSRGPRVGVTKAKGTLRRYALQNSVFVSRRNDSRFPLCAFES